ncbi:hypothetical protein IU494_30330 [Nocardia terpenica]|uniref:hypothetical protein n=1 Tax=Nocardia terpenica TaxID=455432 RepID=UPI001896117C|nr:hypothetical protein [Nocardia terpenica]MBF6064946.1 hypothetical protein [Nocardia terpenica]MBF6115218.1 hypothetical protein [Nocardia terpenica]MBF6122540.1 hypothetical protein [Nocardia terpenica]
MLTIGSRLVVCSASAAICGALMLPVGLAATASAESPQVTDNAHSQGMPEHRHWHLRFCLPSLPRLDITIPGDGQRDGSQKPESGAGSENGKNSEMTPKQQDGGQAPEKTPSHSESASDDEQTSSADKQSSGAAQGGNNATTDDGASSTAATDGAQNTDNSQQDGSQTPVGTSAADGTQASGNEQGSGATVDVEAI